MAVDADNFVLKLVSVLQIGGVMGRLATADWSATTESGLTCYLWEIGRFPMMEPHEESVLAKRWREDCDHHAAHKLVNSHLRLVVKIARGHRGYGLPISAVWWIRASIREYILRSWSLVNIATTANRRRLFFNLRAAKSEISVLDNGDMRHDQVETIAKRLGVAEQDVIAMNGWLSGDASLNAPIRADSDSGEWLDSLVDEGASQETTIAENDELDNRRKALASALTVLNDRERRIFEARRLAEDPIALAELANEFGVSRERVRQIDVSSFEKVRNAVINCVATIETPASLPEH
jgi:RNA polymerase sigma-32 factor